LDISGGIYDLGSITVIAQGTEFTLYALGDSKIDISDTYTLSIALMPIMDEYAVFDAGSFVFNGDDISVTNSSMEFGIPSNDAGKELFPHGFYPTFYLEHIESL